MERRPRVVWIGRWRTRTGQSRSLPVSFHPEQNGFLRLGPHGFGLAITQRSVTDEILRSKDTAESLEQMKRADATERNQDGAKDGIVVPLTERDAVEPVDLIAVFPQQLF